MAIHNEWKMPEWMESYRELFNNTGGNSIEDLMNDHTTTSRDNSIRMALIFCTRSQVALLESMHKNKRLVLKGETQSSTCTASNNGRRCIRQKGHQGDHSSDVLQP